MNHGRAKIPSFLVQPKTLSIAQQCAAGLAINNDVVVRKLLFFGSGHVYKPSLEYAWDMSEFESKPVGSIYQCKRNSSVFSRDGGETWLDVDRPEWRYPQ